MDNEVNKEMVSPMVSMALLGTIHGDATLWPDLLLGNMDKDLLPGFFYMQHQRQPSDEPELMDDEYSQQALASLKTLIQISINRAIRQEENRLERSKVRETKLTEKRAADNFRSISKPAEGGTVKELAERHGVSIAHVRKLKREGLLSQLLETPAPK